MTRKSDEHVVAGGKGYRCLHCGTEQAMAFPVDLTVYAAAGKAFVRVHRACKPSEAGAARFIYSNPEEWLRSWDTGTSSLTIFCAFTGRHEFGPGVGPNVPHDPADFGRCYRLLKVAPPEWRAGLQRVAERFPQWAPLVARWGELEALYEEELPTGKAPRLYARMRATCEIAGRPA